MRLRQRGHMLGHKGRVDATNDGIPRDSFSGNDFNGNDFSGNDFNGNDCGRGYTRGRRWVWNRCPINNRLRGQGQGCIGGLCTRSLIVFRALNVRHPVRNGFPDGLILSPVSLGSGDRCPLWARSRFLGIGHTNTAGDEQPQGNPSCEVGIKDVRVSTAWGHDSSWGHDS